MNSGSATSEMAHAMAPCEVRTVSTACPAASTPTQCTRKMNAANAVVLVGIEGSKEKHGRAHDNGRILT